jgi:fido (protein-threonine AMPylation protein)
MPTKYDVFAKIIEHAPCTANSLNFNTPVYSHIKSLIKDNLIIKEKTKYIPIKNEKSKIIFNIIKYCLKNGLDYNIILSKNMPLIVDELFRNSPELRTKKLSGNKENVELLKYLESNQFILLTKKRPKTGIILKHSLFENIKKLYNLKTEIKTTKFSNLEIEVNLLKDELINQFDDKIFAFLSGSAQLEGGTITIGETKEIILNDIYPEKPKKDIQMIKNLNEAMYYILENINENITENHIKEINKLTMFSLHRNAGKYKISQNKIQGNPNFKTISPEKVQFKMKNLCDFVNTIKSKKECLENIGYIHNELQRIHPFSDGNSRTTRMVVNWILLKYKIPILILKMGSFDEYMNLTKLSQNRDDKKLNKLFQHILIHESLIN